MRKPALFVGLAAAVAALSSSAAVAKALRFSKQLSAEQRTCLSTVIDDSHWGYSAQSRAQMPAIAQVATTRLGDSRPAYIYVFEAIGWCGTAGCPLLIGEVQRDGTCNLLYDDTGDASFTVLRRRDYGYHRIYTPCEARFDGRRYKTVHEDCPNLDVRR